MRATVAILLMGLAFWAAVVDWNATIGTGYAYRFGTLGDLVGGWWPEETARVVSGLRDSGIAWAWDPVGALVLSLPRDPHPDGNRGQQGRHRQRQHQRPHRIPRPR